MNFFKNSIFLNILLFHVIVWCSEATAVCPQSKDYDQQNNPIDLTNYGYGNPMNGFVGAYLSGPFLSTHYLAGKTHLGIDLKTSAGNSLYSICVGTVIESYDMTYQKIVKGRDNFNAYWNSHMMIQCDAGFLAIYGHIDNTRFSNGQRIEQKDLTVPIARIAPAYDRDNLRDSVSDHLHFGINVLDSITYEAGIWGWGIGPGSATLSDVENKGFRDPLAYLCQNRQAVKK